MLQALIKTDQIENNAITSPKIKDGEVKTPDLATAAVTKDKLNPDAVKLVVIERRGEQFNIPPHADSGGNAFCHSDEVVTGGGFNTGIAASSSPEFITVFRDQANPSGWGISLYNSADVEFGATPFAMCAHLELGP